MVANDELRGFLARLLGWTNDRAVDHALRSIDFAVAHRTQLVLCGDGDLVPIAHALHRRMLGKERPFIVADPRRGNTPASVQSPANYVSAMAAFEAAAGGTLCMRSKRPPHDFASVVEFVRDPNARVLLVICADRFDRSDALLDASVPIQVPSLKDRASELPRIIDEYAADAVMALSSTVSLTSVDRDLICARCASSLHAIETATMRIIALRKAGNILNAAKLLGMSHGALGEWFARRRRSGWIDHGQLPLGNLSEPHQKRERVAPPITRNKPRSLR